MVQLGNRELRGLRVLYFSPGTSVHDRRFLETIREGGHEALFLRLQDAAHPGSAISVPEGVQLLRWPAGTPLAEGAIGIGPLLPAFRTILRDTRPDVVHAGPVPTCAFLAALAEAHPLLTMSWGSDVLPGVDQDGTWHRAVQTALQRADMVACDCNVVRRRIRELAQVPDERIVQFPWGVDLDRFAAGPDTLGLHDRTGWGNAEIVLSTRAWEPAYGIETLLEAFRIAHAEAPRLRLLILGGGSRAPQVDAFLREHGLLEMVFAPGSVHADEIQDRFRASSIYVSASLSDGTSVSLLEAMATALPVVVSDIPANREWVVPGENGWLAPVGDAGAFAGCLVEAVRASSVQRARMGRANRKVAEARGDWRKNSKILLRAYDRLAAERGR